MQVGGSSVPGQTSCNSPEMLSLLKTPINTCNNDRTRLIAIINDTSYPFHDKQWAVQTDEGFS